MTQQTQTAINDLCILIVGESATGKSASLAGITDQTGTIYLNCENNKRLPFRSQFKQKTITDPAKVYEMFSYFNSAQSSENLIVIDTLTFLMNLVESHYVRNSDNKLGAWDVYGEYFRNLMADYVAKSKKAVVFLAHTRADRDNYGRMMSNVPIKGALKNEGIESFFGFVVAAKKVPLVDLAKYKSPLLNITEDDKIVGYKHVFQTRLTAETAGERIRSSMGMWTINETFIDNNVQFLLDRLKAFYSQPV